VIKPVTKVDTQYPLIDIARGGAGRQTVFSN